MTILGRSLKKPRLKEKDGYCLLSYFDGYDDYYPTTVSNGNFVNTGLLGNLSELRLGTTSTYLRIPTVSKFGHNTPLLNPNYYGYGLSTDSTAYGLNNEVTMEGWFYLSYILSDTTLLMRSYSTTWGQPYISYGLRINSSLQVVAIYATSESSYSSTSDTSNVIEANVWNHFGMSVSSGGTWKYYFNGTPVITLGPLTVYSSNLGTWSFGGAGKIGSYPSSGSCGGMMAGVRVHNTNRSDSWFRETYNLGRGVL